MDFTEVYPLSVYLSALPFTPINSALYRAFHDKDNFPSIAGGYEKSWSPLLMTFSSHDSDSVMLSVAFYSDKQHLACGLSHGVIRIWDLTTSPVAVSKLNAQGGDVKALAFSADGRNITSGSQDGIIRVWDVISGAELFSPLDTLYGGVGGVAWVAIFPSRLWVIAGPESGGLKIWDLESGADVTFLPNSDAMFASTAAVSPDGGRLLCGSNNGDVTIFVIPSGVITRRT